MTFLCPESKMTYATLKNEDFSKNVLLEIRCDSRAIKDLREEKPTVLGEGFMSHFI